MQNAELRAARERSCSPVHAPECLSRQELAEQVNAYLWRRYHQRVAIDASYIGKLERGVIRWPGRRYREAFRAVLGVPADADLGFRAYRRSATRPAVGGRIAVPDDLRSLWPPVSVAAAPVPATVGVRHIEEIRTAAEAFVGWHHRHGGWFLREAVLAQARWSARLLHATCPGELRKPLFAAVARMTDVCGFMLFDTGDHAEAQRCFRCALVCAEEAGDWHQRAVTLTGMARQALWTGQPSRALTYSEYGLVRGDRTPSRQAVLHAARAKALAATGHVGDAVRAIGQADDAFARITADDDPSWAAFYTVAQHSGECAEAWAAVLASGRKTTQPHTRYAAAREGNGVASPRSRALVELRFAALVMATGDPQEAADLGVHALAAARSIRSGRILDLIRALDRLAARRQHVAGVPDLRHEIAVALDREPVDVR